jgi:hypothetical protein
MGKALTRIGIIGLVAYGGWYLWSSGTPTNDLEERTEVTTGGKTEIPAKNEENLTFEIKKGNKKEIPAKIKEVILKPASTAINNPMVKIVGVENNSVVVTDALTANTAKFAKNTESTTVNVYFYDYGIDLSAKEIPAGNVIFRAINNGRLSHDLTIKDSSGQVDFGRVAPGETKYFKINLKTGYFDILSQVRADQDHDMIELLTVK